MRLSEFLSRLGRGVRTVWLLAGLVLGTALGLEALYRAQGAARQLLPSASPELTHPNAGEPWWSYWAAVDGAVNGPSRFDPYRSWWAVPYRSRWVNVDSAGRRVTVSQPSRDARPRRVVFLGGSVMWGYSVPDSLTIPSLVGRELRQAGVAEVDLINLAQPSYNSTQELITLMLELRAGRRPDVVVSLDGNNDVLATVTEGVAGSAIGEGDLARRSAVGARGFWSSALGLLRYSALLRRIDQAVHPSRTGRGASSAAAACGETGEGYRQVVKSGLALGREYGFSLLYLWQPHWATTRKRLTPWEQSIKVQTGFPELMRGCSAAVDSFYGHHPEPAYLSLSSLFDQDTATVFLDGYGHLTPAGHQRVASVIATALIPLLARPSH